MVRTKNLGSRVLKALVIEDDPAFSDILRRQLSASKIPRFEIKFTRDLSSGLEALSEFGPDLILLDLNLPDSRGLGSFRKVHSRKNNIPIFIISVLDEVSLAIRAIRGGAQEFFLKGGIDIRLIPRMILIGIEKYRIQTRWERLSIQDELTQVYNRRGFIAFGRGHLKLARRTQRDLSLFFIDVDNLKIINDVYGHERGDLALIETAAILRSTFRSSDVIGRIGGDEFAVLAIDAPRGSVDLLHLRLQKTLDERNGHEKLPFEISLSVGSANSETMQVANIEEILDRADRDLYRHKLERKEKAGSFPRNSF